MTINNNIIKENAMLTISDILFSSPCKETGFCQNPNCETAVAQFPETGNWYITFGHAGYNSPSNNSSGYASKNKALAAMKRYLKG
jgi:hypothetical protein